VLRIVYEPDEDGWIVVSIPAIPGVLSQGRSREEAREMILDALVGMIELREADYEPHGDAIARESLQILVDGALLDTQSPRADLAGRYVLVEELEGERVVLAPDRAGPISLTDTRISAIRERSGTQPLSPEEFDRHFGNLPTDGEG